MLHSLVTNIRAVTYFALMYFHEYVYCYIFTIFTSLFCQSLAINDTLSSISPPQRLQKRDREKGRENDRENSARGGSWEGEESEALPPSQRFPRAHHSLPQSSNIFIALACSPAPLENTQGTFAEERVILNLHLLLKFSFHSVRNCFVSFCCSVSLLPRC